MSKAHGDAIKANTEDLLTFVDEDAAHLTAAAGRQLPEEDGCRHED